MARTVNQIQQEIIGYLVSTATAAGLTITPTEWSAYDYRQLITYAAAVAIAVLEQIFDAFTVDTEALVAISAPQTPLWLQNFVLNIFQYSSTVPQILQLNTTTLAPFYPTVDPALRIVTQCVVVPGSFGTTTIKVAKAGPTALITAELDAVNSAILTVTVPGININVSSDEADKIFIGGTVKFTGQYSSVIQTTVPAAIQTFLATIPTTGIAGINSTVGLMRLTDLIAAVRAVPGVVDFELNNINARQDTVAYVPGANNLVVDNDWIQQDWNSGLSGAGYMVTETTSGYTINDSLTYTAV